MKQNIPPGICSVLVSFVSGLRGIDLGNFLIKTAVQELQQQFPALKEFATLSPVTGFRDWFLYQINSLKDKKEGR